MSFIIQVQFPSTQRRRVHPTHTSLSRVIDLMQAASAAAHHTLIHINYITYALSRQMFQPTYGSLSPRWIY